jgi:hypothetical protein
VAPNEELDLHSIQMYFFLFLSLLNLYQVLVPYSLLALSHGTPAGNPLRILEMIIFDFKIKSHSQKVKTYILRVLCNVKERHRTW